MDARSRRTLKWWVIILASTLLVMAALSVFQTLRFGDPWQPDIDSVYGRRARQVDGDLHFGMTHQQVLQVFRADIDKNPADTKDATDLAGENAYFSDKGPPLSAEFDLYIFEPRRFFWNRDDTRWTVRAGFGLDGRLIAKDVIMGVD